MDHSPAPLQKASGLSPLNVLCREPQLLWVLKATATSGPEESIPPYSIFFLFLCTVPATFPSMLPEPWRKWYILDALFYGWAFNSHLFSALGPTISLCSNHWQFQREVSWGQADSTNNLSEWISGRVHLNMELKFLFLSSLHLVKPVSLNWCSVGEEGQLGALGFSSSL